MDNIKSMVKNKIVMILTAGMILSSTLGVNFGTSKVYAALPGVRHAVIGDDVFLGGNYIEVGVNKHGSFGTDSAAPSGFHPKIRSQLGMVADGDGFDSGNPSNTGDFFLPGSPYESYVVAYKDVKGAPTTAQVAERKAILGITNISTTDTSSGNTLSATTVGTTNDGKLKITQVVSFGVNDKYFNIDVTYHNISGDTLYDARYLRSVDPDQDADTHNDYSTKNSVIKNPPQDGNAVVIAKGAVTDELFMYMSSDSRARASITRITDPYDSSCYNVDGSKLLAPETTADTWIAMTYALGDIAPGASVSLNLKNSLNPNINDALAEVAATTATTVSAIQAINVENGTTQGAIGLPTNVDVMLSDSSTTSASIVWDNGTPAYDGNTAGTYAFIGTLTLPSGVANPQNLKATVNVVVKEIEVTKVSKVPAINVANGTAQGAIGLPTNVDVMLSDSSTTSASIVWDNGTPAYDGNTAGTYAFIGTLTLPSSVTNPQNLKAAINVVVKEVPAASSGSSGTSGGSGTPVIKPVIIPEVTPEVTPQTQSEQGLPDTKPTNLDKESPKGTNKSEPIAKTEEVPTQSTETAVVTPTSTPEIPQELTKEASIAKNEEICEDKPSSKESQSSPEANKGETSESRKLSLSFGKSFLNDNLPTGPIIDLKVDISLNSKVDGRTVTATAKGLKPFSDVKIVVYSVPRVLATGKADASGNAVITGTLPDDLTGEQHTIMAIGEGNQGQDIQTIGGFKLSASGTVTAVANPGQVITPINPDNPRLIRAVNAGKPLYDIARYPSVVATVMLTITGFLGLAGAGGLSRGIAGKNSNTKKLKGKLAGVVTKKLKALKSSESSWGDTHKTWAFPGTATTDLWGSTIPNKFGKFSAIAPRVLVDGSWSRAMFGSAGYILWIIGAVLGIISTYSVNFMALPPALPIVLVIVALSILDSAVGGIAWIIITFCPIVTGNVTLWSDVRTLLGIFVLFASLPLLSHVIRPLRRSISGDFKEIFDRVADYVMPPIALAFAASSMLKALNGLSGLVLFNPEDYNKVRVIVGIFFVLRVVLEDIATYLYPIRSTKVQPQKLVSPGKRMKWISVVMRVVVTVLIVEPFVGLGWLTYLVALLIAIPMALKIYEDDLINFKLLHKWFPRGSLKFTILMIIGIYLSSWLLKQGSGVDWARQTYVLLLVPGFISSCIEFFAREGGYWPDSWLNRVMGTGVWVLSTSIVLGIISLV